jgi:Protein of unknown function (DUF4230)
MAGAADRNGRTVAGDTDTIRLDNGRPRRMIRTPWSWPARTIAVAAVVTAVVLVAAFAGLVRLLPQLHNPFAEREVDRSGPAVLQSIQDLSRYEAAAGTFQVVIDLEHDTPFIPGVIKGQRTLFVAVGTVGAYVDFGRIGQDAIEVSGDRRTATITLPAPALDRTNLDSEKSYVFAQQRGILDRLGSIFSDNPDDQRELYAIAEQRIQAAAGETGLVDRAERNTRSMLIGMLSSLGFTTVIVNFEPPQP